MKLFNHEIDEPKFKYEDVVWVYFNPNGLVDKASLPIFKCDIEELHLKAHSAFDKPTTAEYAYTVGFIDTFDNASWKDECEIFYTEKEAKLYALLKLTEYAERLKTNSNNFQEILKKLKDDND